MTDTDTHLIEEMFVQLAKGATVSDGQMTWSGRARPRCTSRIGPNASWVT